MLADLESLEKRVASLEKRAKGGDKEAKETFVSSAAASSLLSEGRPARSPRSSREDGKAFGHARPADVQARPLRLQRRGGVRRQGQRFVREGGRPRGRRRRRRGHLSAAIESEIAAAAGGGAEGFLEAVGLEEPGLNRLIRDAYALLGLRPTSPSARRRRAPGPSTSGATAPQAAGVIHTDFEKGFIRAETIAYDDYVAANGEAGARDAGKMRLEGKDYVVEDGDVMHFRFAN